MVSISVLAIKLEVLSCGVEVAEAFVGFDLATVRHKNVSGFA